MRTLAALALILGLMPACAAQVLQVQGIVSPAWVERAGGAREPLVPGIALANRDRIHTGAGGRVLLRMAEGSAIKLGGDATLALDQLAEKRRNGASTLFTAALDVVKGAFRFTTGVFGRARAERDVQVRISAVTAGIRGTDVWGKSEPDRDTVCLVEGRIAVEHAGRRFTMQDPLSFYIVPRRGEALPVAPVSRQQLKRWVDETEIHAGSGAIQSGGRYRVEAAKTGDSDTASALRDKLRRAGFAAQIETASGGYGNEEHLVYIDGLAANEDAEALAARLRSLGFSEARASR